MSGASECRSRGFKKVETQPEYQKSRNAESEYPVTQRSRNIISQKSSQT